MEEVLAFYFVSFFCAVAFPFVVLALWLVTKSKPEFRPALKWAAMIAVGLLLLIAGGLTCGALIWGKATLQDIPMAFFWFSLFATIPSILTFLAVLVGRITYIVWKSSKAKSSDA